MSSNNLSRQPQIGVSAEHASPIVRTCAELRRLTAEWRQEGHEIGLVPTMGALHEGHLTLVRRALEDCSRAVVSIFVNPAQFGPSEDLSAYPRREAEDAAALAALDRTGQLAIWAPDVAEMYPLGFATAVTVSGLTKGLCGATRIGHFEGVATVVSKLLNQVQPLRAYFGEKDYQQLQVIRRMTADLDIPAAIIGVPTLRESDGLALSSRNAYLTTEERVKAAFLVSALRDVVQSARQGDEAFSAIIESAKRNLAGHGFGPIDYIEICDAETLEPVADLYRPARVFAAARLGKTRLIDNLAIPR